MAKAQLKTQVTAVSVSDFIATVADPRRRTEAQTIDALLQRITGQPPRMWGPSIIGYGSYDYRYDSGREGTMCRIGFSPRKAQLVIYLVPRFDGPDRQAADALLAQLDPHSQGKSCLYIKRLDTVDMAVLDQLLTLSWRVMAELYPA